MSRFCLCGGCSALSERAGAALMPDTDTRLSPAAMLVVHLMITHLRNTQNTWGQKGNEVIEQWKHQGQARRGWRCPSTRAEVALWKQADKPGTAPGEEPTPEKVYAEGHGKDPHCNKKKCEEGAAYPYPLYCLSYRKDTDELWVKKWQEDYWKSGGRGEVLFCLYFSPYMSILIDN